MPDEPVKAIGLEAVIGLHRDQDAEAVAKLKDSSHAHESADRGDDQPQVADSVAVDRPTVETIEMRWEPRERDGENNQGDENPSDWRDLRAGRFRDCCFRKRRKRLRRTRSE